MAPAARRTWAAQPTQPTSAGPLSTPSSTGTVTTGRAFTLLGAVVVLWGANWPIMKVGLESISPLWFGGLRMVIGAAVLFALLAVIGRFRLPPRQDWPVVLSVGLLHMTFTTALMYIGLTYVEAGRAALLSYTTPLWVAPLAVPLLGELSGSLIVGHRYLAWQLDNEQPRLMGLPSGVRQAHEAMVKRGEQLLTGVCQLAQIPIAQSLGLPRRAIAPVPVSSEEVARRLVAEDLEGLPEVPTSARSQDSTRKVLREDREPSDVPRLAIIVPLKDEAEGIDSLFFELSTVLVALSDVADCEFVIVDDGSTDQTWALLEKTARSYPRVRLVRHECNRGVAAAIRTGMLATTADWVASIDGDLSYDPMELRAMLPLLANADIVTASPYHSEGSVRNVPEWRLFLSRTLSRAYRVLLRSKIATWTSCFRVYRRQSVVHLPIKNSGFLGTAELLVRVLIAVGSYVHLYLLV
ncbi:MAG TPA: glycosyltransferase, partial [Planctomycetes bacterium]|nr:glycosyltransferase [Planctomycetota bacterium]